ncbi:unnamed protein product [Schistocephalus solidus]|uniref:Reverse transcriptase domain-containing protein n=1 Tax=Schistocephalus solidus TaxID=70667 RepID=A0A183TGU5_SCHSO|nr:unnamed protein product [Schistocephalus solidus]
MVRYWLHRSKAIQKRIEPHIQKYFPFHKPELEGVSPVAATYSGKVVKAPFDLAIGMVVPFGQSLMASRENIVKVRLHKLCLNKFLLKALYEEDGVELAPGRRLADLDYADDIALLASNFGDLQSIVSRVNEVAKSVSLSINAGKTKVFSCFILAQEKAPLEVDGCQLEEVDSFKYLGARMLPNGQSKDDIVFRIDAARRVFSGLRKCLWTRRDISITTKIRVYRASAWPVLFYGCECWATRVEDERKLEAFDHQCLRTILRVKYIDFVSNGTVRNRCANIARISQAIQ